jgi:hypothetical protein
MNRLQKWRERNFILNEARSTTLSGYHGNCFRAYASESDNHINLKFKLWLKLVRLGYEVYTEVIWRSGDRSDLIAFKEGIWLGFEVINTEKEEECLEKIKKYPMGITWEIIKSEKDIDHLLV